MIAFVSASGDYQVVSDPDLLPPDEVHVIPVPPGFDPRTFVWNGADLVDRSTVSTWYVDEHGTRRAFLGDPSWTVFLGAYNDPAPDTVETLLTYASDRQNAILAGEWTFNVAATGATAHQVTTRLDDSGQLAMMKLGLWLQRNAASSDRRTMPYSNVDGSTTTLTYAEVATLVEQAGDLDIKSYDIFNPVCDQIRATPPKITTRAQIDAALAAISA